MDIYHGWCDLKEGVGDLAFARAFDGYLQHLKECGAIAKYRLTRRKLGLGPRELGEFHFMIETENLAQLEAAFALAASRRDPTETVHHGVNSLVRNLTFALYRDFPDAIRHAGEEKF
jgi:hypothetical protein